MAQLVRTGDLEPMLIKIHTIGQEEDRSGRVWANQRAEQARGGSMLARNILKHALSPPSSRWRIRGTATIFLSKTICWGRETMATRWRWVEMEGDIIAHRCDCEGSGGAANREDRRWLGAALGLRASAHRIRKICLKANQSLPLCILPLPFHAQLVALRENWHRRPVLMQGAGL